MAKKVDTKIVARKNGVGFTASQQEIIEKVKAEHIADGTAPQPLAMSGPIEPKGERNLEKHVRLTASPDGDTEEAKIKAEIEAKRGRNRRGVLAGSTETKKKDSERRTELVIRFILQNWSMGHIMRMCYELWETTPRTVRHIVQRAQKRIQQLSERHAANALVHAVGFETAMMRVWWDDFDKTRSEVDRFKAELLKTQDEIFRLQMNMHDLTEKEASKLVALTGRAKFLEAQVDKGQSLKMAFSREATSHRRRLDQLAGLEEERVAKSEPGTQPSGPGITLPGVSSQKTADEKIADLFSVVATRMVTYGHETPTPPVVTVTEPAPGEEKAENAEVSIDTADSGTSGSPPIGQEKPPEQASGADGLSW